jgi:molecular chaperone DnaK
MMREAEANAAEDNARSEYVETRNLGESVLHSTEKFLADNGDKIPTDAKSNVTGPLAELKTALDGTSIAAIKEATEKVSTAASSLGEAMYANTSAPSASAPPKDDDVVDAEIVD